MCIHASANANELQKLREPNSSLAQVHPHTQAHTQPPSYTHVCAALCIQTKNLSRDSQTFHSVTLHRAVQAYRNISISIDIANAIPYTRFCSVCSWKERCEANSDKYSLVLVLFSQAFAQLHKHTLTFTNYPHRIRFHHFFDSRCHRRLSPSLLLLLSWLPFHHNYICFVGYSFR